MSLQLLQNGNKCLNIKRMSHKYFGTNYLYRLTREVPLQSFHFRILDCIKYQFKRMYVVGFIIKHRLAYRHLFISLHPTMYSKQYLQSKSKRFLIQDSWQYMTSNDNVFQAEWNYYDLISVVLTYDRPFVKICLLGLISPICVPL